jgi:hypothetical protein
MQLPVYILRIVRKAHERCSCADPVAVSSLLNYLSIDQRKVPHEAIDTEGTIHEGMKMAGILGRSFQFRVRGQW